MKEKINKAMGILASVRTLIAIILGLGGSLGYQANEANNQISELNTQIEEVTKQADEYKRLYEEIKGASSEIKDKVLDIKGIFGK